MRPKSWRTSAATAVKRRRRRFWRQTRCSLTGRVTSFAVHRAWQHSVRRTSATFAASGAVRSAASSTWWRGWTAAGRWSCSAPWTVCRYSASTFRPTAASRYRAISATNSARHNTISQWAMLLSATSAATHVWLLSRPSLRHRRHRLHRRRVRRSQLIMQILLHRKIPVDTAQDHEVCYLVW